MLDPLVRLLSSVMSPAGADGKLIVLIYHRVHPEPDSLLPEETHAGRFDREVALLRRNFNVLRLGEAVERLKRGSLPARAACITFDDGYADNAHVALPILQRYRVPATFFIATGYLDGGIMFNDGLLEAVRRASGPKLDLAVLGLGSLPIGTMEQRRAAFWSLLGSLRFRGAQEREQLVADIAALAGVSLPRDLMLRTEQVRQLHAAGMEIGAHTVTHPILANIGLATARAEMAEGREQLEDIVRAPVRLFAYPNGKPGRDYRTEHVGLARELGFVAAVSTARGVATRASDPLQLPRFTPWDRTAWRFGLRLASNYLRTQVEAA